MAEHFSAYGRIVHFSNGGCEELFRALVSLGKRSGADPEGQFVVAELQRRIDIFGAGCRSFDLDQPPDSLDSIPRLHFLGRLIATFAWELQNENPDPTLTEINWDRSLRIWWLARVLYLHDMLRESLPPHPALRPLLPQLPLSQTDEARCEIQQLLGREAELRRGSGDVIERLAIIEQVLSLVRLRRLEGELSTVFADLLEKKASILEARGYLFAAINAMREAAAWQNDPESRELWDEIIAEMAKSLPTDEAILCRYGNGIKSQ